MKSETNKIMKRNNSRVEAIKNLATSLKTHAFRSPTIGGNAGDFAYRTSRDYRTHVSEIEYWKATSLAAYRMSYINR